MAQVLLGRNYHWKAGAHGVSKISAEAVGQRLDSLVAARGGTVTPRDVVADARNDASSPYRDFFEWDDSIAGERFREEQARDLISHLVVVKSHDDGRSETVRAFVVVGQAEERGYIGLHVALSDAQMRAEILGRALQDLRVWREKYRVLKELAAIFRVVDEQIEAIGVSSTAGISAGA